MLIPKPEHATLIEKTPLVLAAILFFATAAYSQKEFFHSQQSFTKEQLGSFYSSISIHEDFVIFNANDHRLYAYNKNDGSLKWSVSTKYKTSIPVFVQDGLIYASISEEGVQQTVQLKLEDGQLVKPLPFGPLATKPFIRNGILYGTAIYNYGCIIACDLAKDTVLWSRFIAHGFSRQPYYLENKILANAEGSSWVELGYDGTLLDTTCKTKAAIYVNDIPCVRTFAALTHDGLEIKGKFSDDIFGTDFFDVPDIITTKNYTYILSGDKLNIISKKLKLRQTEELSALVPDLVDNINSKLIKADDESVWILHADHLLQYDHKTKKLIKQTDLTAWQPRAVVLDGEKLWLVSGKDGLLYGISL